MHRGIIHTAIRNKTLRLELEYNEPSRPPYDVSKEEWPAPELRLQSQPPADEFACLLSVI